MKNKLFFFGGYQGTRTRQQANAYHQLRPHYRPCSTETSALYDGRQLARAVVRWPSS